jgi:hypothetical protein
MEKTAGKQRRYVAAYWANERVPDLADLLTPINVDAAAFSVWLAPLLGRFRGLEQIRPNLDVPPAEQAAAIRRLLAALHQLQPLLDPFALPPPIEARMAEIALRADVNVIELTSRLRRDLITLAGIARATAAVVPRMPGKRGAKPKSARNELLSAVIERLRDAGCTARKARELAELILVRCRIDVPADERAVQRAAAQGRSKLANPGR